MMTAAVQTCMYNGLFNNGHFGALGVLWLSHLPLSLIQLSMIIITSPVAVHFLAVIR